MITINSKLRILLREQETTQITRKPRESLSLVLPECVILDFNEN